MTQVELDELLAEYDGFVAGFRPSRSNPRNVWRDYGGDRITVFVSSGRYSWCIHHRNGRTQYSRDRFEHQEDAMSNVWREIAGL